jgi:hypothetical protein
MHDESPEPSASSFAWTDLVLAAMGVVLVGAFLVGLFSSVPLRIASSVGSVVATATWLGSVAVNPSARDW